MLESTKSGLHKRFGGKRACHLSRAKCGIVQSMQNGRLPSQRVEKFIKLPCRWQCLSSDCCNPHSLPAMLSNPWQLLMLQKMKECFNCCFFFCHFFKTCLCPGKQWYFAPAVSLSHFFPECIEEAAQSTQQRQY